MATTVIGGAALAREPRLHPNRFAASGAQLGLLILRSRARPAVQVSFRLIPFEVAGPRLSTVIE